MAASKGELWAQLASAIKILDQFYKFAASNVSNFITLQDILEQSYEGVHINSTASALRNMRSSISSQLSTSALLSALILELAKNGYNSVETTISDALGDIAEGLNTDSETIKNRAWTHGAIAVGGANVGNGTIYRLVTDKFGDTIEAGHDSGGIVKAEISSDKNTGLISGQESAVIYGSGLTPTDQLDRGTCTGETDTLTAIRSEDGILSNGSFETHAGTGGVDITFTEWTLSASADFTNDTGNYFRLPPGATSGQALEFLANGTLTQYSEDFSMAINKKRPVFLIARYYRKGNCDGTLTLRLGSKTVNVVLPTKANTTWYDLILGIDDENGWYQNYIEDSGGKGFRIVATLTGHTTGTLLLDDVILAQPVLFNGLWYLMTAGSYSYDFLVGDYFTFTDSVLNTGIMQYWISRLYNKHLPHTVGVPTYADA